MANNNNKKKKKDRVFTPNVILGSSPGNYIAGVNIDTPEVVNPSGNWINYTPEHERQNELFETSACFLYDAPVLMEDLTTKRISEIKVGDYVITHKGRKQKVVKTMVRDNGEKLVSLKIKGTYKNITCTKEHPILTTDGWRKSGELTTNDYVLLPLLDSYKKDASLYEIEKSPDFLWFIGLFLAEGSLGKPNNNPDKKNPAVRGSGDGSGSIVFSLHEDEKHLHNRIISIGEKILDTRFTINYKKDSKGCEVRAYNYHLKELLNDLCSSGCRNKRISKRLMLLEPELQLSILRGWIDGDGCVFAGEKKIYGVSASEELIKQMYLICLRNKIRARMSYRKPYTNSCHHQEAFEISIDGVGVDKILNTNKEHKSYNDFFELDGCSYLKRKIVGIEEVEHNNRKVYNVEVENDNSYIVNNVAVHNCTCFSNNDAREALFTFLVQNGKIPAEHDQWLRDNGYYKNGKINFDDRVPAMYADITLGVGTYLWKAAEACRKWSLPQDVLPKPRTIAEYYDKTLMTQKAINLQAEFDKRFKWIWFWDNSLVEGLTYSPVVGTVAFMNGDNILCPITTHNHAVVALNMDKQQNFVVIDDSYAQQFKRYCLQGFADYLGWKLLIIQNDNNNMDKVKFIRENDTKQVRNKDTGAYGVIYGGQLLKITPERAGLYMIDREARGLIGKLPTIQVSDADWNLLWRPSPEQEGRYF